MDYAVDLGIMSTPAIEINGALIFSSLPSPARLRKKLSKLMAKNGDEAKLHHYLAFVPFLHPAGSQVGTC